MTFNTAVATNTRTGIRVAFSPATIFTTAGIILVLGVQSFAFFRLPEVSITEFFFGTTLKPAAHPPNYNPS